MSTDFVGGLFIGGGMALLIVAIVLAVGALGKGRG